MDGIEHIFELTMKGPLHDFFATFAEHGNTLPVEETPRYIPGGDVGYEGTNEEYAEANFVDFLEEVRSLREELSALSEDIDAVQERLETLTDGQFLVHHNFSDSEVKALLDRLETLESKLIQLDQILREIEEDVTDSTDKASLGATLRHYDRQGALEQARMALTTFTDRFRVIETTLQSASMRDA